MADKNSLSEKLLNNRIVVPNRTGDEIPSKESAAERFTPEELADRMRDFSMRFASLFPRMNNAEIARRLRTTDAVIKNYTEGKRFPTPDVLLYIQLVTRCDLHWLMTGENRSGSPVKDLFSEEKRAKIQEMATVARRTFNEEVEVLTTAAVEFIEKI